MVRSRKGFTFAVIEGQMVCFFVPMNGAPRVGRLNVLISHAYIQDSILVSRMSVDASWCPHWLGDVIRV